MHCDVLRQLKLILSKTRTYPCCIVTTTFVISFNTTKWNIYKYLFLSSNIYLSFVNILKFLLIIIEFHPYISLYNKDNLQFEN